MTRNVRWKSLAVTSAISLGAMSLAACGAGDSASSDDKGDIKVGVVGSMNTVYGEWELLGVEIAVDKINAEGGLDGRKIVLVTADTEYDPTKAVSEITRLIQREKVDFVIGPTASAEVLASLPILTKANMASFPSAGSEKITPEAGPYAFTMLSTTGLQAQRMIDSAKANGLEKIAILHDDGVASVEAAGQTEKYIEESGLDLVATQTYKFSATDVTPQILSLRKSEPDVVIVWATTGQDVGRIMQNRNEAGWDVPVYSNTAAMSVTEVKAVAGEDGLDGLAAVAPSSFGACGADDIHEPTATFIEDVLDHTGAKEGEVSYFYPAYFYDGMRWLQAAYEATKTTDGDKIAAWIEENAISEAASLPLVMQGYDMSADKHHAYGPEGVSLVKPGEMVSDGVFQREDCD